MNELMNNELIESQQTVVVICPMCQKSNLKHEQNMIRCMNNYCQFRTITNLNLIDLNNRLNNALQQHQCNETPTFQFKNCTDQNDALFLKQFGILSNQSSFLIMSCDHCNFLHFII